MAIITQLQIAWQPSPNFWQGRRNRKVEAIVIHITDGTLKGVLSWFSTPKSQVSAHYVIAKDGKIIKMVKEEDSAWHAGVVIRPKWSGYHKGINPNLYTIGIEMVGFGKDRFTYEQTKSLLALIRDIARRQNLILNDETVINHRDIDSDKTCPGIHNDASILLLANWLAN